MSTFFAAKLQYPFQLRRDPVAWSLITLAEDLIRRVPAYLSSLVYDTSSNIQMDFQWVQVKFVPGQAGAWVLHG